MHMTLKNFEKHVMGIIQERVNLKKRHGVQSNESFGGKHRRKKDAMNREIQRFVREQLKQIDDKGENLQGSLEDFESHLEKQLIATGEKFLGNMAKSLERPLSQNNVPPPNESISSLEAFLEN